MALKKYEFQSRQRSPLRLLFSLAMALLAVAVSAGEIGPSIDTYGYGAIVTNNTGVVAEGFIIRLDQMTPDDIEYVHTSATPGYNPESEAAWGGDLLDPLNVWWWGSLTNLDDTTSIYFESSKPIVSGYAEWLDDHNGILVPLPPGFEIVPAAFQLVDGRRGLRQLKVSVLNPSGERLWVQRSVNTSRQPISLNDLVVFDRLHLSGNQLDSVPIPIYPGDSVIHVETLDKYIVGYILTYQLFEDDAGTPGVLVGTFSNSINMSTH